MPYIKTEDRERIDEARSGDACFTPGNLNYLITKICLEYARNEGAPSYHDFNDIVGAIECAKLEMYARLVRPYEDLKIISNGDVYE